MKENPCVQLTNTMGHLRKKSVHLTLNAQPNFQFLVNPADTSIKEIASIGQVFGILYIEDVIHHQYSCCTDRFLFFRSR